jgi:hypothetical protein
VSAPVSPYVLCVCVYVCMYVHACMYVCMCMHVCVYTCMYVCIYIRMYACVEDARVSVRAWLGLCVHESTGCAPL